MNILERTEGNKVLRLGRNKILKCLRPNRRSGGILRVRNLDNLCRNLLCLLCLLCRSGRRTVRLKESRHRIESALSSGIGSTIHEPCRNRKIVGITQSKNLFPRDSFTILLGCHCNERVLDFRSGAGLASV